MRKCVREQVAMMFTKPEMMVRLAADVEWLGKPNERPLLLVAPSCVRSIRHHEANLADRWPLPR